MLTIVKISQIFVRIQNVSVLIRASNNTARAPVRTVKFSVGLPFTEQTVMFGVCELFGRSIVPFPNLEVTLCSVAKFY